MSAPLTTALAAALTDPEVRALVLRHVERRSREGLREAAEHSLGHRLLGSDFDGSPEAERPSARPPRSAEETR